MATTLVHIDLKGAPFLSWPQGQFWESFCCLLKRWRVTGLVIEWEDSVSIPTLLNGDVNREFAYTRDEAIWMVNTAKKQNLQVIPLVQTFGHLEFLLKSKHRKHLREVPDYPNCISAIDIDDGDDDETFRVISGLIDDVVGLTPDCPAIHLGGDEVWHLGHGPKSQARMRHNPALTRDRIYIEHMNKIVDHVCKKYPGKRLLLWDDMLRSMPEEVMAASSAMTSNIEPVVWNYTPDPAQMLNVELWNKYSRNFSTLWIATAFKGATSSCAQLPLIRHHVTNHLSWLELLDQIRHALPSSRVGGFILTGWQRFDHFASLCELLPVAIPSLFCCLSALQARQFGEVEVIRCSNELGLDVGAELRVEDLRGRELRIPNFPGGELYLLIRQYLSAQASYNQLARSDALITWFPDYNVSRGHFSPLQLQLMQTDFRNLLIEFRELEAALRPAMAAIYPLTVLHEWFGTYFEPTIKDITKNLEKANSALDKLNQ